MKCSFVRETITALSLCVAITLTGGCLDEQHPGQYYTYEGNTIATFLEENEEQFSSFISILKAASYWGEMNTYGKYTCFAPTNDAVDRFIQEKGFGSLDNLLKNHKDYCDTISMTHLVGDSYFIHDLSEGGLPRTNFNDRFLTLSFDSVVSSDGHTRLRYCINKNSHITEFDDTVQNGVVHVVDKIINFGGDYIYDVVLSNPDVSIFAHALRLVGLEDSLKLWYDETYSVGLDSVLKPIKIEVYEGGFYDVTWWERRKTNFTFLVEPDSIYNKHGIYNVEDLIKFAKDVYDESYPDDAGLYDDDFTNRKNPLNRFVSYHILPFYCGYRNFNLVFDFMSLYMVGTTDPEDYFEPYADNSLMRVSTNFRGVKDVFVNALGREGNGTEGYTGTPVRGARIYSPTEMGNVEQEGRNGIFHYIDDIICYSAEVRDRVLNKRLRVDWTTISPEFLTSGARHRKTDGSAEGVCFKQPKNFHLYSDCVFSVRSPHKSCYVYEGNAIDIVGAFDFWVKLPPVPRDGTYELRFSFRNAGSIAGVVQNYLAIGKPDDWQPLGIPTDLRVTAEHPSIGWVSDEDLGDEESIRLLDKAMRNRGYMKSSDAIQTFQGNAHRNESGLARRILTTDYFYAEQDYYARMKLVLDNPKAEMTIDYMEWVPKSVFDNDEDKH
ncbi:MAG: fasciclin domain-containing protein [Bacteroidaceae bacterium]|nr:fasciclin domain-containing protein [Bacteroidaceae bacterium]